MALNLGGSGSLTAVTIDRTNPTVTVNDRRWVSQRYGTANSLVTFTFSEAPTLASRTPISTWWVALITGLAATVDPLVWTAQFTATDGFTGTGSVSGGLR